MPKSSSIVQFCIWQTFCSYQIEKKKRKEEASKQPHRNSWNVKSVRVDNPVFLWWIVDPQKKNSVSSMTVEIADLIYGKGFVIAEKREKREGKEKCGLHAGSLLPSVSCFAMLMYSNLMHFLWLGLCWSIHMWYIHMISFFVMFSMK